MKAVKGGKKANAHNTTDPNLLRVIREQEKQGRSVKVNEGQKYSEMLLDLIEPYHVADAEEMEDLLECAAAAWNAATLKKLAPPAYKSMVADVEKSFRGDEEAVKMFEAMVLQKEKKYGSYETFIDNVEMGQQSGNNFYVTATVKPFESFIADSLEKNEDEDIENNLPGYLDRHAISVKPKQPFIDYIQAEQGSLFPFKKENNLYLVKDTSDSDNIDKWLEENFDRLFVEELREYHLEKKQFPPQRTLRMFKDWFDVDFFAMPHDLEAYPISKTPSEEF